MPTGFWNFAAALALLVQVRGSLPGRAGRLSPQAWGALTLWRAAMPILLWLLGVPLSVVMLLMLFRAI